MLLLSPVIAANAIGSKCESACGADNPQLLAILQMLTSRVEGSLNTGYIKYGESTDYFVLPSSSSITALRFDYKYGSSLSLRLSNAFVDRDAIAITDPNGDPVTDYRLNAHKGIVEIPFPWCAGEYTVVYSAGIKPIDPPDPIPENYLELADLAEFEWLQEVVVAYLVIWYRVMYLSPKIPQNARTERTEEALRRELSAMLYQSYQRPRANLVFPRDSVRTV